MSWTDTSHNLHVDICSLTQAKEGNSKLLVVTMSMNMNAFLLHTLMDHLADIMEITNKNAANGGAQAQT